MSCSLILLWNDGGWEYQIFGSFEPGTWARISLFVLAQFDHSLSWAFLVCLVVGSDQLCLIILRRVRSRYFGSSSSLKVECVECITLSFTLSLSLSPLFLSPALVCSGSLLSLCTYSHPFALSRMRASCDVCFVSEGNTICWNSRPERTSHCLLSSSLSRLHFCVIELLGVRLMLWRRSMPLTRSN